MFLCLLFTLDNSRRIIRIWKHIFGGYTASSIDYGLQGGVEIEIAKSSLLNVGLSYLITNREQGGVADRYGNDIFKISVGYSVFLR
jgi:hypothetical protein